MPQLLKLKQKLTLAALAASLVLPAQAQVKMDAAALRGAATTALKAGDSGRAVVYADALLVRDRNDLNAHLIRARGLRDQGKTDEARKAADAAWTLADTDAEKYATSLITAQVLSSQGKRTRAQFWLRRAAENAPNDLLKARAKRDFSYVQKRNPWSTQLSFTFAPNSNINNGSSQERSVLNYKVSELLFQETVEFDLPATAQAIPGFEIGASLNTRYRFKQSAKDAHDVTFGLSYRSYILSDSTEAGLGGMTGSDFAFGTVSLGYAYERINMKGRGRLNLGAEVGQSFYGGSRYSNYTRIAFGQSVVTDRTTQYRFGASYERQNGQATTDLDRIVLTTGRIKKHKGGNVSSLTLAFEQTSSINARAEYNSVLFKGGMALAKPVMGAKVRFNLGAELRDFDFSQHSPNGRRDMRIFADATAVFEKIDYYGFSPAATVSISRTNSNIGLYDVNRFGVSLGIKSSF